MTLKKLMFNKYMTLPSERRQLYGIFFMILMAFCFSFLDALAKYISNELPLFVVLWGRYVFHFLFITLFFFRSAPRDIIYTQRIKLQIFRSILIFCGGVTLWRALMFLPLADCTAILFSSPFLVTVLSVPILGESVGVHRWGVVIAGLFGVMIIIRPGMGIFHWVSVLPLVTALIYACFQIITRILGSTDNALTTLFYSSCGGLVFSSIAVFFVWVPPSVDQWPVLALLGFFGAAGHYFMIKAFEIAPVSLLAPFDYTALIWAIILGFVLFRDLPDAWVITGIIIIVSSGLYLIKHEKSFVAALTET